MTHEPNPPSPRLAVAIVCKDNDATIARTLDSIKGLADEIVAVDSGSSDNTIPLLEAAGARIIRSPWLGHIRTKQLALDACRARWILCLDSDESLLPELQSSLRDFLAHDNPAALGAVINRKTFYQGRPLNHAWQPEPRLRLVRRGAARWGGLDPHDKLELINPPTTTPVHLRGDLRHDSFPTFTEHLRKQWSHATTMAHSLHAAGHRGRALSLLISPPGAFLKQLILKRAFLDGYPGLLAAASSAAAALIKHAALIELSRAPATASPGTPPPPTHPAP